MIRLIKPDISPPEIKAVAEVLASGRLVCGPVVERLEQRLQEYLDMPQAVCVSSGTAALHLALLAAGIKHADEVIVPAFTFPATANAVEMVGAVPVFIDCAPGDVNLDVRQIEKLISARTKAIIPVHAFGMPAEIDFITELAKKRNLVVIEDAACALGSKYKNKYCGTFGDFGVFSFHPRKLLTTGEGGAIVTRDSGKAALIKSLRNHGYEDGDYVRLGYNYRMTDFQAAAGLSQSERFRSLLERRKKLAQKYRAILRKLDWVEVCSAGAQADSNIQSFIVRVADHIDRDKLIDYLRESNIEAAIGTYCVPLTRYYVQKYGYKPDDFPGAYGAYKKCLTLPLYNDLSENDLERILAALKSFEKKSIKMTV
jgi:perosamine synthetase